MNIFKSTLIAFFAIITMTSAFGQDPSKQEKKENFRNGKKQNSSKNEKVLSNDYSFSITTGTYLNLTESISLNNNQIWDDPEFNLPIGFTFRLFDIAIDSLYSGFGVGGMLSSRYDSNFDSLFLILPFEADLIDRGDISGVSQSPISYKLEGTPGTRILKIEWRNAGFYEEGDLFGTLNDYINFQLWLYEGSNSIEIHFGANMVTNPILNYSGETGAVLGLSDYDLTNAYLLSGSPSNPIMVDSLVFLNGTPTDGDIYKFSKIVTGIDTHKQTGNIARAFPNPFHQSATVEINDGKLHNVELKVIDIFGRTVISILNIQTNVTSINRENLINGIYFFQLIEEEKIIASGKLIIK